MEIVQHRNTKYGFGIAYCTRKINVLINYRKKFKIAIFVKCQMCIAISRSSQSNVPLNHRIICILK